MQAELTQRFIEFMLLLASSDGEESFRLKKEKMISEFALFVDWSNEHNKEHVFFTINTLHIHKASANVLREFITILPRINHLISLSITETKISQEHTSPLCAGLSLLTESLRILSLNDSKFEEPQLQLICEEIAKLSQLKHLGLSGNNISTPEAAKHISFALSSLTTHKKLSRISLHHNQITDESLLPIRETLIRHQFSRLDLSYNQITDLTVISSVIGTTPTLEKLYLDGNILGLGSIEGFQNFAKAISRSKLASIGLNKNGILRDQFQEIVNGIAVKRSQLYLELADNTIGDGLEALGALIAKQPVNLPLINLRGNSIPNTALTAFAKCLQNCKGGLRELNLSKNNIPLKTGSLLFRACVSNNSGIEINLEDNSECVGLLREIESMKVSIKELEYAPAELVTLAVVSKSPQLLDQFEGFFEKIKSKKKGSQIPHYYQIEKYSEKAVKDYYYCILPYLRRHYLHFGGLLDHCFRVVHVVVENISNQSLIAHLRSWIALISSTTKKKVTIIIAVTVDNSVDKITIDKKESQLHDLISEMSYVFQHIEFTKYPLFVRENPSKDNISVNLFQKQIRAVVESTPVYLPKILLERLIPEVSFPKALTYEELKEQLRELPNVGVMEAPGLIQKMLDTGLIFRISNYVVMDPIHFHNELIHTMRLFTENEDHRAAVMNTMKDFPTCINEQALMEFPLLNFPSDVEFQRGIATLLTNDKIWYPLIDNDHGGEQANNVLPYFYPPFCDESVYQVDTSQYEIGKGIDSQKAFYLGRRIVAPLTETITPRIWYLFQALLYKLLVIPEGSTWKFYNARDCVCYYHDSGYAFRVYFNLKFDVIKSMRLLELHIAGKTVAGVVALLYSTAALIHHVYESFGLQRLARSWVPFILQPAQIISWRPEHSNQEHNIDLYTLLRKTATGKTEFNGLPYRSLMPDILYISETSIVDYRVEENDVMVEITVRDQNNVRHCCLETDEVQVMLFHPSGKKIIGQKYTVPGNIVLAYCCEVDENENPEEFLLVVTLLNKPIPVGETPVYLSNDQQGPTELLENWKKLWEPATSLEHLEFFDPTNYLNSRNEVAREVLAQSRLKFMEMENEDENEIQDDVEIRPARTEELTTEDYLRICVDGIKLAKLAYANESKEYVSKHCIQRQLNKYSFHFLPDYKQKLKVFYFSSPVSISWFKTGKTCFYTFERGGDLYISIRGTKTGADIIVDLQYNLTPYQANVKRQGKLKRLKKRVSNQADDVEMIHNGFSVYADRIIEHFRESYSEMLHDKEQKRRLFICGHSLGGGIAQVIARKMLEQQWKGPIIVVTFGSPLIGNNLYCNWEGWRNAPNLKIFNFANQKDPVTNLLVRSWSVFTRIGVAPKLDFGYTAKALYAFSCNTAALEVIENKDVLSYLQQQVAWHPKELSKYTVSHTGDYYTTSMTKLMNDFMETKEQDDCIFIVH